MVSENAGSLIFLDGHSFFTGGGANFNLFRSSTDINVGLTHEIHSNYTGKLQIVDKLHRHLEGVVSKLDIE